MEQAQTKQQANEQLETENKRSKPIKSAQKPLASNKRVIIQKHPKKKNNKLTDG